MSVITNRQPEPKMETGSGSGVSMTEAEYLEREKTATQRSEYRYGRAVFMPGGSNDHATLIITVGSVIKTALRGKGCRIGTDQRIRANNQYYYPDVVAICADRVLDAFDTNTLLTPMIIVEILSDSTEDIDRNEKLENYRTVSTLSSYLLIAQDHPQVEHYEKSTIGEWEHTTYTDESDIVELHSVGRSIALADIYDDFDMWNGKSKAETAP